MDLLGKCRNEEMHIELTEDITFRKISDGAE